MSVYDVNAEKLAALMLERFGTPSQLEAERHVPAPPPKETAEILAARRAALTGRNDT